MVAVLGGLGGLDWWKEVVGMGGWLSENGELDRERFC